ncbi:hypothetical protein [Nocardia lijiangensis]|uniref:hypothetical protein n=1 Tax=Nocardia lijiangensis TaxID=299618 RepID=UPI003D75C12B
MDSESAASTQVGERRLPGSNPMPGGVADLDMKVFLLASTVFIERKFRSDLAEDAKK